MISTVSTQGLRKQPLPHTVAQFSASNVYWKLSFALVALLAAGVWRSGGAVMVSILIAVFTAAATDGLAHLVRGQSGLSDGSALYTALLIVAITPAGIPPVTLVTVIIVARVLGCHVPAAPGARWFSPAILGYWLVVLSGLFSPMGGFETMIQDRVVQLAGIVTSWIDPFATRLFGLTIPTASIGRLFGLFESSVGAIPLAILFVSVVLIGEGIVPMKIIGTYFGMYALVVVSLTHATAAFDCVFHGGVILVGVFVLADPSTWPRSALGMVLYGALTGATAALLVYGRMVEHPGLVAVLFVQPLVPLLDGPTAPCSLQRVRET